jgi:hypothetical protein
MQRLTARLGVLIQVMLVLAIVAPAPAAATPVSGPRETVDSRLTTKQPNAAAGFHYTGRYHAAGDPNGDPPYMRKMISYNPSGRRYDTSVPARCTATDVELALRGVDACPPGSRLGGGKVEGKFMGFAPNTLDVDVVNNTGEQIFIVRSPAFATVARQLGLSPNSYPLALAGSVLLNQPGYRDHVLSSLANRGLPPATITLVEEPVRGAVAIARTMCADRCD